MPELVITQNTKALQDLQKSSVLQTLPYFDDSLNITIKSWIHPLETMTSGWHIDRVTTIIQLKLLNKAKAYSDRLFRENTSNNPGRDLKFADWKKSMIAHFDKTSGGISASSVSKNSRIYTQADSKLATPIIHNLFM